MKQYHGFTLIEVLIALTLFALVATGIYLSYANLLGVVDRTRARTLANSVLEGELEFIRSLPYGSVDAAEKEVTQDGRTFSVSTTVEAESEYKLVEVAIDCPSCFKFAPLTITMWVAP